MDQGQSKPNFQASTEALRLFHFLEETEEGQLVSYETISSLIGRDAQTSSGRTIMYTAQNMMRREHGALFGCITNTGIKRLPNEQRLDKSKNRIPKITNQVRRGQAEIETVIYQDLPDDEHRTIYNTTFAQLGALKQFSRSSKKLVESIVAVSKTVSLSELIERHAASLKQKCPQCRHRWVPENGDLNCPKCVGQS